jgi:hypothetical protein
VITGYCKSEKLILTNADYAMIQNILAVSHTNNDEASAGGCYLNSSAPRHVPDNSFSTSNITGNYKP